MRDIRDIVLTEHEDPALVAQIGHDAVVHIDCHNNLLANRYEYAGVDFVPFCQAFYKLVAECVDLSNIREAGQYLLIATQSALLLTERYPGAIYLLIIVSANLVLH